MAANVTANRNAPTTAAPPVGYAGKRLTHPTRCSAKSLYLNTAAACPWIPACAGMTVSEEIPPYLVIPAQAGIQKVSGHCNI